MTSASPELAAAVLVGTGGGCGGVGLWLAEGVAVGWGERDGVETFWGEEVGFAEAWPVGWAVGCAEGRTAGAEVRTGAVGALAAGAGEFGVLRSGLSAPGTSG